MMPTCRCARVRQVGKVFSNRNLGGIGGFLKGGLTKHKVFHQTGAGSDCKCFASAVAKRQLCIVEILVMEEQREGWWEGFCLDMEAQEAYGEVHLGLKSKQ